MRIENGDRIIQKNKRSCRKKNIVEYKVGGVGLRGISVTVGLLFCFYGLLSSDSAAASAALVSCFYSSCYLCALLLPLFLLLRNNNNCLQFYFIVLLVMNLMMKVMNFFEFSDEGDEEMLSFGFVLKVNSFVVNSMIKLTSIITDVWGKRNKQLNNKRDRDDDAIIQTIKRWNEKNTINLFTQFGVNLFTLESNKSIYKKFSIGLQELILILPKS
jgi:hypothetical protein